MPATMHGERTDCGHCQTPAIQRNLLAVGIVYAPS
jgi:hypothetical protein